MVGECRRLLTDDVCYQIQTAYGLQPDGTALAVQRLTHLDDRGREVAQALRGWQEHLAATDTGSEAERKKAAFDRIARETAFTALNRLAALRMCEERGHVIECVRRGTESDGFVLYERFSGGVLGSRGDTYRLFLERVFEELAEDLGAVFDLQAPQSLVFPRERCVEEVLALLNKPDLAHLWKEDETIGWIYQYFNSKEEREKMRDESASPRNSRELAVRNQFFTPRYVVEFLVDNTLGRIWYEMRKGETALKDLCRYLVCRPREVFLEEGQQPPSPSPRQEGLDQEELIKQPVYIAYRSKKDPRDLKILDPACGSGHFLLYAFDLLETIYEEAWAGQQVASEATGKSLHEEFSDQNALRKAIPELILRYNLHGIDIDLRACQIAALALWLRAQRSYQRLGLQAVDRPKITRSNIVCAEPMPGEQKLLDHFLTDLRPAVVGQLVRVVFEKMKLAGEAGSLLKIEQEIAGAVAEAKQQWLAGPQHEQTRLFTDGVKLPAQEELGLNVSGITDEAFWEKAEECTYRALQSYAEQVEYRGGYQRRLFAEDAARGFAFIDLCRRHYDIILMNPPFGEASERTEHYFQRVYPEWNFNLFCCFVARALLSADFVGAITDRAYMLKTSYEEFRRKWLLEPHRLERIVDLGWGVLDANVEVNLQVFQTAADLVYILDLSRLAEKRPDVLSDVSSRITSGTWVIRRHSYFLDLPNAVISYLLPQWQELARQKGQNITTLFATAKSGLKPGRVEQFVRLAWEIPEASRGTKKYWTYFQNGSPYAPYYYPTVFVLWYEPNWAHIKAVPSSRITGLEDYWRPGLSYGKRTDFIYCYPMPEGQVFSNEGMAVFPNYFEDIYALMGFVNSSSCQTLMNLLAGQHKAHSYFNKICLLKPIRDQRVSQLSRSILSSLRKADSINETSLIFTTPFPSGATSLVQSGIDSSLSAPIQALEEATRSFLENSRVVAALLGDSESLGPKIPNWADLLLDFPLGSHVAAFNIISYSLGVVFGRWDIRFGTGEKPAPELPDAFAALPECPPGMLRNEEGLPLTQDDVRHLQAAGQWTYPLDLPWDGILVDDEGNINDIVRCVREVLVMIWRQRGEAIEQEACEILGVKDLREYFRKPALFFADHLKRYSKSRRQAPIYWPLSTASGTYTLWVYYHRLSDASLYTALNRFVRPKIDDTERQVGQIESELPNATGRAATKLRDRLEESKAFLDELREFRDELQRVAALPYEPNLNDGVLVTAAPLWRLFRLPKWSRDLRECWAKLENGEYEWAHQAYSIWPERVREICKRDRSIAIAHGMEAICEVPDNRTNKKQSRKQMAEAIGPGDNE
jgi:hypothetical protein